MNKLEIILLVLIIGLAVAGCVIQPGGVHVSEPQKKDFAMIASSVSDYREKQILASVGKLEKEDLEETGGGGKSIFTDEWITILPDGTVVTVVRVLDDKNTPGNHEDDTVTVTRSFDIRGGEYEKLEKIERPRRPEADWGIWEDDTLIQHGNFKVFFNGVKLQEGTIVVTWRRQGEEVGVRKIEKDCHMLDRNGVIVRFIIDIDEEGLQTKTQYRIKLTGEGEVVVHSFTYEEFEESGEIYTKIVRDDGSYAIVRNERNPRIVEYYTVNDVMRMRSTETGLDGKLFVEKEFFDDEGSYIETRRVTITFRFLGDEVIITKTFEHGGEIVIRVEEAGEFYRVHRFSWYTIDPNVDRCIS